MGPSRPVTGSARTVELTAPAIESDEEPQPEATTRHDNRPMANAAGRAGRNRRPELGSGLGDIAHTLAPTGWTTHGHILSRRRRHEYVLMVDLTRIHRLRRSSKAPGTHP